MENDAISVEKPFLPAATYVFPYGAKFMDKTIYKESYLPGVAERMIPFIPCGNISIPSTKMSADTTSKVTLALIISAAHDSFFILAQFTFAMSNRYANHLAAELSTSLDRETEANYTVARQYAGYRQNAIRNNDSQRIRSEDDVASGSYHPVR